MTLAQSVYSANHAHLTRATVLRMRDTVRT